MDKSVTKSQDEIIEAFGLKEDLMAFPLCKAHNLVFNGRAIARAAPGNAATVNR